MSIDESSESRTLLLDNEIYTGLCSREADECFDAISELPEALSVEETSHLGTMVLIRGKDHDMSQRGANRVVYRLGLYALHQAEDLVSAESAVAVLKDRHSYIGWAMLKRGVNKAKENIISAIMEGD